MQPTGQAKVCWLLAEVTASDYATIYPCNLYVYKGMSAERLPAKGSTAILCLVPSALLRARTCQKSQVMIGRYSNFGPHVCTIDFHHLAGGHGSKMHLVAG